MENPVSLKFLPANQAWVFVFGDQIIEMDGQRFFPSRKEAVEAADRMGFLVGKRGRVSIAHNPAENIRLSLGGMGRRNVEREPWEMTRAEYVTWAEELGESMEDAWFTWPSMFIEAVKRREDIPAKVVTDHDTRSIITYAAEEGYFTLDDISHLYSGLQAANPVNATTIFFVIASTLSMLASLTMMLRPPAPARNPVKPFDPQKARKGLLLAAAALMARRNGNVREFKSIRSKIEKLFPKTWQQMMLVFGDPDDPIMKDAVYDSAGSVLRAASERELESMGL